MPSEPAERDRELRRFYRAHVTAVYAFLAYSVSKETAEDLTSVTFERAIKAWERFDAAKASERTWVLAIARNALTDHFRRQKFRAATSLDEHPALLATMTTTEDPLALQMSADGVVEWLGQLGERDREVLALRFGADLSASEVAAATGLSESNVHQIVSRSLRRLRSVAAQG